jgi:antitoxin (DNA-binding transcriptional repressor) of toxin-antitoxin stability system
MRRLKTVGIKELKNNLSAYLREVRNGATVLVSDRNSIVAELHEPYRRNALGEAVDPLLKHWAETGLISLPANKKVPLPVSPVKSRAGTSAALLKSGREEPHE